MEGNDSPIGGSKLGLTTAAKEQRSPLAEVSQALQKAVSMCQDEAGMLQDKLQPILAPAVPSNGEKTGADFPPQSDVTMMLMRETEKLVNLSSYLRELRIRSEV